jgi:GDP-4-dehydro-6-deoxy-D-mannose reductase
MPKRRILITGARGFVGGVLQAALKRRHGEATLEFVDFVDPESGMPADLMYQEEVSRAVAAAAPDVVFHLAAIAAPRDARDDPQRAWQVNVMGTLHLAQAVLQSAPTARLIWSGSSESYGLTFNRVEGAVDETAALSPASAYGATKAAADLMLGQLARDGLDSVRFRPFNHTGAGQLPIYVVPAFAQQVARIEAGKQEPIVRVGNLEARRDFLDVRDVVDGYIAAADTDKGRGEVYNLSTGKPVAIGEILDILISLSTVAVKVEVDPARYLPNTVPTGSGNPEKAVRDLGWQPQISLKDTLSAVLDYWRQNL